MTRAGKPACVGLAGWLLACALACSSDDAPSDATGSDASTPGGSGSAAGAAASGGAGTAGEAAQPTGGDAGDASAGATAGGSGGDVAPDSDASTPPASGDGGEAATLDPPPGEYGEREVLPFANSEMAVAELDGKIYVVGGYPSSRQVQTAVQVYDIAGDTWSEGPPLPIPIHHPVLVAAQGKLYSLGGQGASASGSAGSDDLALTLVHDPAGDPEWVNLDPDPPMTPRGAGAGAVIDDRIYVIGGRPPANNAFEVYDISDNAWTALEPLPRDYDDRNHLAAAAIAGKIYVAGGRYDSGSFTGPITDALDVYDPGDGAWGRMASMPRPRGGVNGVAADGCFHVWGGEAAGSGEPNDVFPDHDVYDPVADTWTSLDPLPTPVHGVTGAAFVDGLIYMPGGGTSSGGSSGSTIFQVYRPAMRCQ